MSAPAIVTTPPEQPFKKGHGKRGSIATPIDPTPSSPAARRMSSAATPQYTMPLMRSPRSVVPADPASHPQLFVAGILASIVLTGIMYSLIYDTSLDTSVATFLPERSAYLARKTNILNQLFVKKSWGWTTLAFMWHWTSSPPSVASRQTRLVAFALATFAWIGFNGWFFGPSLNHRIISMSGGTCAISMPETWGVSRDSLKYISLPGQDPVTWGEHVLLPVPHKFCSGTPATAKTLPGLYAVLQEAGVEGIKGIGGARWHAGFDISGHTFLLTLSSLILARELAPSWRIMFGGVKGSSGETGNLGRGGSINRTATLFGTGLIALWAFMLGVTAVYFHNPPEKISGLAVGLLTAGVIFLLTPTSAPSMPLAPTSLLSGFTGEDENAARRGAVVDDEAIVDDDSDARNGKEDKKTQ